MSYKTSIRLAAVLAILTLSAQPACSQVFFRPFIYPYYNPGMSPYSYPTMPAGYGTFSSGVYTPSLYGYSNYSYYPSQVAIVPGFGASSGDSVRVRSDLSSALAVPADSPMLLAAWDAPTGDSRAAVVFVVPNAGTRIWVEGQQTTQTGMLRRFTTPPLQNKKRYEYDVRAQWLDGNGQWQSQSQTVEVRAGAVVNVVFAKKTP
jgi:uncharacterized protein (TIGR03000 family)